MLARACVGCGYGARHVPRCFPNVWRNSWPASAWLACRNVVHVWVVAVGCRPRCLVVVGQFPGCSLVGNTLWRCHLSTPRVTLPQGRGGCTRSHAPPHCCCCAAPPRHCRPHSWQAAAGWLCDHSGANTHAPPASLWVPGGHGSTAARHPSALWCAVALWVNPHAQLMAVPCVCVCDDVGWHVGGAQSLAAPICRVPLTRLPLQVSLAA